MNMNISNKILIYKNGNLGNLEKNYLKNYYTKIKMIFQKYRKLLRPASIFSRKEVLGKVIIMAHPFQLLKIIN